MKCFAIITLVFLISAPIYNQPSIFRSIKTNIPASCYQETNIDEIQIERAVTDLYIKGLKIRDFSLIRTICIPEAKLMSTGNDGKLHITTLDTWSKRFDPKQPPFKKLDYSIVKIDKEGMAAQVKILFVVDSNRRVTDYLHMLKLDGQWRIVNIIDY